MKHYDIIVVGGGLSGVGASIAGARAGKRTLLIEKYGCLGGVSAFNLVMPFMPYYTHDPKTGARIDLSCGIFSEIMEALKAHGGVSEEWEQCFNEEALKYVLNKMTSESGVELLFGSYVSDAVCENGTIKSITVSSAGKSEQISADYFIDATGDANLATLCGFESIVGRESDGKCQPLTLSFRLANVDIDAYERCKHEINALYKKQRENGKITNPRENVLIFKTPCKGLLHFNSTRVVGIDPTNPWELSRAELIARKQVFELVDFLKESFDAFKDAYLISSGVQIGARESRKIVGEYTLTKDDIVSLKRFEDSIAVCNYDIDIHSPDGTGTSHYYFKSGDYYTIPYRCLIPRASVNLLVAGRCVSATHEAQASLRIMPTCVTLGQACGVACAIAHNSHTGVREIDIRALQEALVQNGAKIY